MNKLSVKNLEFWGRHGKTGDEGEIAQPFGIDIAVKYDFKKSIETDDLENAVDYKIIEKIAQRIIEGKRRILLERLASDIVNAILSETKSDSVEVLLTKLRAKSPGLPSVYFKKTREKEILNLDKKKVEEFYNKDNDGILHFKGILYKILEKEKVRAWYEKKRESFEKKEEKILKNNQEVSLVFNGPYEAIETFDSTHEIGLHTLYRQIRNEIEKYSTIPFKPGDRLETKLIKYPPSKLGVEAHRDLSSNINCIILMNIYGTTTLYTSSDKNRSNEKAYLIESGDIVIMRGPRTKEENSLRPLHYVLDVDEERLVFVCREIEDATENIINKNNWMGF